ncbi:MAG: sigma-70 family RNA polymerase sigma factor [Bacteroidota bacterium]
MAKQAFSNEEVIKGIKAGGITQEKWLLKLYETHFSLVYKALEKHKVQEEQAMDAYSDALLEFRKKIVNDSFRGDSHYFSFLYSIFFNKIFNALAKNKTKKVEWVFELPQFMMDGNKDILQLIETNEAYETLLQYMNELGEPCSSVLLDHAYWGYSMAELAERHNFKDAATARSKKFHCLKKLLASIRKKKTQPS